MDFILYTDDFPRGARYEALRKEMVITADWRGAVGLLRANPDVRVVCELSSARSIDALRMVLSDPDLKETRIIGVDCDSETTATAKKMGLKEIIAEDDFAGLEKWFL